MSDIDMIQRARDLAPLLQEAGAVGRVPGVVVAHVLVEHPVGCQKSAWPVSCSDDERRQ